MARIPASSEVVDVNGTEEWSGFAKRLRTCDKISSPVATTCVVVDSLSWNDSSIELDDSFGEDTPNHCSHSQKNKTNMGAFGDEDGAGSLARAGETGTAAIPPKGSLISSSSVWLVCTDRSL